jgi:hypothetical protein
MRAAAVNSDPNVLHESWKHASRSPQVWCTASINWVKNYLCFEYPSLLDTKGEHDGPSCQMTEHAHEWFPEE